jgi:hypothetical protein
MASNGNVWVRLDKAMEFEGKVTFASGTPQGTLEFGFFQIGRPFEAYKAIWSRAGAADPDIKVDEMKNMRNGLPAQDHATVFYQSPGNAPQSAPIDAAGTSVAVTFDDTPRTPFNVTRSLQGVDYQSSFVQTNSFFFTGFGLVKNGQALLLATRYWTMRYCEAIPPAGLSSDGTKKVAVSLTPVRDCRSHSGDLGEPGAGAASNNAPGWGNGVDLTKTYAAVAGNVAGKSSADGPSTFDKNCG